MSTLTRTAVREALISLGINTQDLTEARIGVKVITLTRLARNPAGQHYRSDVNTLATDTETINITES